MRWRSSSKSLRDISTSCGIELPPDSPVHKALGQATPIEHSLDGVEFEGYTIPCDERQARLLLEVARSYCPEIIRDIQNVIKLA